MTEAELKAQIEALRASLSGASAEERKNIMDQIAGLSRELHALENLAGQD